MIARVIEAVIRASGPVVDKKTMFHINPTGRFVVGGPTATPASPVARSSSTPTGISRHGGGAVLRQGPCRRSHAGVHGPVGGQEHRRPALARKCEVQVAYAIGVAQPVSIMVDTFGTAGPGGADREAFADDDPAHLRPPPRAASSACPNLRRPIYRQTAALGHFGRSVPEFTCENRQGPRAAQVRPGTVRDPNTEERGCGMAAGKGYGTSRSELRRREEPRRVGQEGHAGASRSIGAWFAKEKPLKGVRSPPAST